MALTGNKGEWSEVYALLKLLGDKELYAGDKNLHKNDNLIYPILQIVREETQHTVCYNVSETTITICAEQNKFSIPIAEFQQQANVLLKTIHDATGVFSAPDTESFMHKIICSQLKAKSYKKADIKIVIHDLRTGFTPTLGFSIKSQLGADSTLLNAGATTNFIYSITPALPSNIVTNINNINSKQKIKDRVTSIQREGSTLKLINIESPIFYNNLTLIDSKLPEIIGHMLVLFYSGKGKNTEEITKILHDTNPLKFNMKYEHRFYEYKIKRMLSDAALGMMPNTVWSGILDANGGYIVIKEDGDIVCYHIYNRNEFEDYLFFNTKFETASSTRHKFGAITTDDSGQQIFKLNLQIRFI